MKNSRDEIEDRIIELVKSIDKALPLYFRTGCASITGVDTWITELSYQIKKYKSFGKSPEPVIKKKRSKRDTNFILFKKHVEMRRERPMEHVDADDVREDNDNPMIDGED